MICPTALKRSSGIAMRATFRHCSDDHSTCVSTTHAACRTGYATQLTFWLAALATAFSFQRFSRMLITLTWAKMSERRVLFMTLQMALM